VRQRRITVFCTLLVAASSALAPASEKGQAAWIHLSNDSATSPWQGKHDGWTVAGNVGADPTKSKTLTAKPGQGVLVSMLQGRADLRNLVSKQTFGDLEVHVEFFLPKDGNGGVKLQGLYEIQICDSHAKQELTASDCGGVYPRAELKPRYHLIDEGVPPRANAAKPPDVWQTLDIVFQAPRFDAQGKKTANARFVKVVLNDKVIHEDVELKWPTGHAWRKEKEVARGPLFLQGDHGPVAYRNVRVRAIRSAALPKPRPNIVLIMCDDMGWSDIGCYGGEIHTPNIDKLAAEGLRFTQFYNNAVCWTTRASLLTGRYPRYPRPHLTKNVATVAELLQEAGYQTALSGKWHLGRTETTHPFYRGFDQFYGLLDGCCNYFDPFYRDPKYKRDITGSGYRYFAENTQRITEFPDDFYTTDAFSDRAVQMIRRMTRSKQTRPEPNGPEPTGPKEAAPAPPFFLHVCYTAPHYPLHAKPADIAKYRGKYTQGWEELRMARYRRQLELGLVDPDWKLPTIDPEVKPWNESPYPQEWQQQRMEVYAAMIDCMDQGIGRILRALEETGVDQNTLVMFLSDNGSERNNFSDVGPHQKLGAKEVYMTCGPGWAFAQNTPFRRFKASMHEGGIATPMIARWPGHIRPNTLTPEVAHIIDFLPTCLELAGTEPSTTFQGREILPVEGRSFVPVLHDPLQNTRTREAHAWLFWELSGARAVRRGDWKLVTERDKNQWELYNLESDRTETNNLAERFPERVERMEQAWWQWAEKTGAAKNPKDAS